jgi:hypothetical protein
MYAASRRPRLREVPLQTSALSTTTQIIAQPTPAIKRQLSHVQKPTVIPSPTQPTAKINDAR